jgi:hypothetical protein
VKQVNTNLKLDKAAQTAAKHVKQVNTKIPPEKPHALHALTIHTNPMNIKIPV